MSPSGYKLLGYVVWNGGKWYLRRSYRSRLPSRGRVAAGLGVTVAVGAGALLARRNLS